MDPEQSDGRPEKRSRLFTYVIGVAIVLVILGAFTLLQRRSQYQALAEETETLAIPTVSVFHPTTESTQEDLVLPGTMQAPCRPTSSLPSTPAPTAI
jgi:hypothetical protein